MRAVPGFSSTRRIRRAVIPGGHPHSHASGTGPAPELAPVPAKRDTFRFRGVHATLAVVLLIVAALVTECSTLPDDYSKLRSGAPTTERAADARTNEPTP